MLHTCYQESKKSVDAIVFPPYLTSADIMHNAVVQK